MASKQEVLDAIAQEKAEITAKLDALNAQIADLQNQINQGAAVTAADLDEIKAAINNIFVP